MASGNGQAAQKFINSSPIEFWNSVGVFPEALERLGRLSGTTDTARELLAGLGVGNLRLLAEEAKIPKPDDAGDRTLANFLLSESDPASLIHLKEFMRRRTEASDTVFQKIFQRKKKALEGSLAELSPRRAETLKPFTKLLLLYRRDPQNLRAVHTQALWQSRHTAFEFETDAPLPANAARVITQKKRAVCELLTKAIGKRPVEFISSGSTADGLSVFTFFREYAGIVRPDFRDQYNVHYGCGLVLFAIDGSRQRMFVKSGNRDVANALNEFIKTTFNVGTRLLHDDVFSDYTSEELCTRVLGAYESSHGIEIAGAAFARSGFGNHGSITLGTPFLQASIRPELLYFHEHGLVDIHGPGDIHSLALTYRGRSVVVTSTIVENGAVRFSYENTGWDTEHQDEFEATFQRVFGIPLNRLLHPSRAALGTAAIYSCLFNIGNEEETMPFHEEFLEQLVQKELIARQPIDTRICRHGLCKERGKPVDDESRTLCVGCERELHDVQLTRLERNTPKIAALVGDALDDADDWQFDNQAGELDGNTYYELRQKRESGREDLVSMILADRPSAGTRRVFNRTGLPIAFVQTSMDPRHVYIDDDGSAHISVPYLLSAKENESTWQECKELCKTMLQRLVRNHEERILRAARISCDRLLSAETLFSGDSYELDIFNLLRSIFPYTYNLGGKGKIEPDGYVCLPHYERSSIEDVGSWNWSYDAKYSNHRKGYDLNIDERRKMVNYIKKLRRNRRALFGRNRRLRAHVIISNNMTDDKIAQASKFVFGPDGVGEENKDIRLILMRQEFLVTLYERVRDSYEAIIRRRPFFGDEFTRLLQSAQEGQHLILDAEQATSLMGTVLELDEVEANINPTNLSKKLED